MNLKYSKLVPFILLCSGISYASDFRNADWGMSKAQIKSIETKPLKEEKDFKLTYADTLDGEDVNVAYVFKNGKFYSGYYVFEKIADSTSEYKRYASRLQILKDLYGKPMFSDCHIGTRLVEDREALENRAELIGAAVNADNGECSAYWNLDGSDVYTIYQTRPDVRRGYSITNSALEQDQDFQGSH